MVLQQEKAAVADNDNVAYAQERQAIQRWSDAELMAFWSATEAVPVADERAEAREVALIGFAADELAKRGLLPA